VNIVNLNIVNLKMTQKCLALPFLLSLGEGEMLQHRKRHRGGVSDWVQTGETAKATEVMALPSKTT
jgi:hypothetical protein